jgi:hypothetical protein
LLRPLEDFLRFSGLAHFLLDFREELVGSVNSGNSVDDGLPNLLGFCQLVLSTQRHCQAHPSPGYDPLLEYLLVHPRRFRMPAKSIEDLAFATQARQTGRRSPV